MIEARRGATVTWTAKLAGTVQTMAAAPGLLFVGFAGTGIDIGGPGTLLGEPGAAIAAIDTATGAPKWRMPFEASEWAMITSFAATSDGLVAGGSFSGTLRAGTNVVSSAGKSDGFVVKLDAAGKVAWLVRVGGPGADAVQGVAARDNRIAIAGTFAPGAELRGTPLPAFDERVPYADIFVAELDATGTRVWSATFGGKLDDSVQGVAIDTAGRVAVASTARQTIHFAGTDLVAQGDADGLVAWYSRDGVAAHAVLIGGPDFDGLRAITSVGERIVVAGFFSGGMRLGDRTITAGGGDDAFVVSFDDRGAVRDTWQVGGPGREEITSLAAIPGGFLAGIAHTAVASITGGPDLPATKDPMVGAALVIRPVR